VGLNGQNMCTTHGHEGLPIPYPCGYGIRGYTYPWVKLPSLFTGIRHIDIYSLSFIINYCLNSGVGRFHFFRYGLSDFASLYRFWMFLHDYREESPHNMCNGCYVLDSSDSSSRLLNDVDHVVRLFFFMVFWCWYSC
jgi:hypothetical protein